MLLKREQLMFLAAVLIGAYGIDRGLTAMVWLAAAYYATRRVAIAHDAYYSLSMRRFGRDISSGVDAILIGDVFSVCA